MCSPMEARHEDAEPYDPSIDWDWDYLDAPDCQACGGPCGVLGQLGRRVHWICRDCGLGCSTVTLATETEVAL